MNLDRKTALAVANLAYRIEADDDTLPLTAESGTSAACLAWRRVE